MAVSGSSRRRKPGPRAELSHCKIWCEIELEAFPWHAANAGETQVNRIAIVRLSLSPCRRKEIGHNCARTAETEASPITAANKQCPNCISLFLPFVFRAAFNPSNVRHVWHFSVTSGESLGETSHDYILMTLNPRQIQMEFFRTSFSFSCFDLVVVDVVLFLFNFHPSASHVAIRFGFNRFHFLLSLPRIYPFNCSIQKRNLVPFQLRQANRQRKVCSNVRVGTKCSGF